MKLGSSPTSLILMVLLSHHVVITKATNVSYQVLKAQTGNTIDVVAKVKKSLASKTSFNETQITEGMMKWDFGISHCWNYSLAEDDRLRDNYIRLKVLKHHALVLNMTTRKLNVVVEIGNLHRAVKRMRGKLGYAGVNVTKPRTKQFNAGSQQFLEITFLTALERNLYLMLNDFEQRSKA